MNCGYPLELFAEQVDDRLVCKLCDGALRKTKTTPCGQFYCNACLESWKTKNAVCPRTCCNLVTQNTLAWAGHIDAIVSGLKTHCKNADSGCKVQVPLREKSTHELLCPYSQRPSRSERSNSFTELDARLDAFDDDEEEKESLGFFQRATKIVLSFRSAKNSRRKQAKAVAKQENKVDGKMLTQRTYRLKRNRPKEPLGLVLVSGDKTADGRHKSYYVKKVNRDTLGWRAGILAGDTIIKVDNHDLSRLTPQESVARIKEKTVVTITVLRDMGANKLNSPEHNPHIYDEIYSDHSQQQHALSQPLPGPTHAHSGLPEILQPPALSQYDENHPPTPPPMDFGKFSPSTQHRQRLGAISSPTEDGKHHGGKRYRPTSPAVHISQRTSTNCGPGERTSKDSGLSSGSSDSPNTVSKPGNNTRQLPPTPLPQDLDRDINARKSYRTENEMVRKYIKTQRRNGPAPRDSTSSNRPSRNCRVVGEYELEDIHLKKNGTSQLGITLGYDTSAAHGSSLYVCEIVSGGLAAMDGRLRTGDIIQMVNGFKVFDPEEAILLFLEQDQDITLSVARKIKAPSKFRPQPVPDLEHLESTILRDGLAIRKVDSCGCLDSHSYHDYATLEPPPNFELPSDSGIHSAVILRERARDLKMLAMSYDSVNSPSSPGQVFDDELYHSRRSSTPGRATKPFGNSRQMTGSSPNLLRMSTQQQQRSPPSFSHQTSSGSPATANGCVPLGPHNHRFRLASDRPSSTSPDNKQYRPLGGVIQHHKLSSPSVLESPTINGSHDHEPRIMAPPSPTKTPPSFQKLANDIHRLPNRFENTTFLDPSSAGATQGRRESLV